MSLFAKCRAINSKHFISTILFVCCVSVYELDPILYSEYKTNRLYPYGGSFLKVIFSYSLSWYDFALSAKSRSILFSVHLSQSQPSSSQRSSVWLHAQHNKTLSPTYARVFFVWSKRKEGQRRSSLSESIRLVCPRKKERRSSHSSMSCAGPLTRNIERLSLHFFSMSIVAEADFFTWREQVVFRHYFPFPRMGDKLWLYAVFRD